MVGRFRPKTRVPLLRLVRRYGGWHERFFLAYFYAYIASAAIGLVLLVIANAPSEVGYAFTFAAIFGISGLFVAWFGVFITSVPVMRAYLDAIPPDHPQRGLVALHLAYLERYSVKGRFPRFIRFGFAAAFLNTVFTVASVLVGYALEWMVPEISPTTMILVSGAWIIVAYGSLAVVSIRIAQSFSREAAARGYNFRIASFRRTSP